MEKKARREKDFSQRLVLLEHDILGNGSIGIKGQLKQIREDIKDTRRILFFCLALMLLIIGDRVYEIIKTAL